MFCNNTRLSFFHCQKDAAGAEAALKKAAPALVSGQQKKQLQLHPKSGGSSRLRLRNTELNLFRRCIVLSTISYSVRSVVSAPALVTLFWYFIPQPNLFS